MLLDAKPDIGPVDIAILGGGLLSETVRVLNALPTKPSSSYVLAMDRAFARLKASGILATYDYLQVYAAATSGNAAINWVTPGTYNVASATATFTALQGYQGDGATTFVDTGYAPTGLGGRKMLQDSTNVFLHSRTAAQGAGNDMGARSGAFLMFAILRNLADIANGRVNEAVSQNFGTVTDGSGFFAFGRPNASIMNGWRNGVKLSGGDVAQVSSGLPGAGNIYVCAANGGTFSARQFALSGGGGALTDAQHAEQGSIWTQFAADVGY